MRLVPHDGRLVVDCHDSTARHASERATATLVERLHRKCRLATVLAETNEAVFRATNPRELFEAAVGITVDHGGLVMVWIATVSATGTVEPLAWAGGSAREHLDAIRVSTHDEPAGWGVVGLALRAGEDRCCEDISSDPSMAPFADAAARAGFRSAGAFPLLVDGSAAGVLAVYSSERGYFGEEEMGLVHRLAANVAYGWEALRRRADPRDAEVARRADRRLRAVLSAAPDAIVGVGSDGRIELANAAAERLFGWVATAWRAWGAWPAAWPTTSTTSSG